MLGDVDLIASDTNTGIYRACYMDSGCFKHFAVKTIRSCNTTTS